MQKRVNDERKVSDETGWMRWVGEGREEKKKEKKRRERGMGEGGGGKKNNRKVPGWVPK